MRIWVANHYAVPPNMGGITRHFELAREWAEQEEADVTLWLSSFNHSRRRFIDEEAKRDGESVPGLTLKWLWSFPHDRNDWRRVINMVTFTLLFFLQGLFHPRPHVLLASSPHLLTPFAGWMLAKLKRCPFTLEVRDLWPDTLIKMDGIHHPWVIKALLWMESFLYRKADKIVVLTEYQRRFIQDKGVDPAKITLIPNGIRIDTWKPDPTRREEYRRRMGVAPYQYVALYAGAHGPANALEHVVLAGEYLPDGYAIVLIGDGPEKDRLRTLKQEKGLHNVHLLDPVPKEEVFRYIEAADCGIISLKDNEIFRGARPNKLFDYMCVGKPIVSTVDGEVREIIEENGVGAFSGAEDPKGLAKALMDFRNQKPEERDTIAQNGHRYIRAFGNRKSLASRLYGEMRGLMSGEIKSVKELKRM